MNKPEMIKELERLMELTNAEGKGIVGMLMLELGKPVIEPEPMSQRRGEVRDQGESDQHVAEKMGYVKK